MSHPSESLCAVNHAVDRVASRQHSLITTEQLRTCGFSDGQIARFRQKGAIRTIRRGVHRLAGGPVTWIQVVHAVVLAAGPGSAISHITAAVLWQFRYVDRSLCGLHVTAGRVVRLDGVLGHTVHLGPGDTGVCQGVPVTTPERTLIDLATILPLRELGRCLDDALRRRLISLERLRKQVESASDRGGRRLLAPLHHLLAERIPGYNPGGSDWEREMDGLWDRLGLETGVRQYRVTVNGRTYVIDRAIPELKFGVEFNGYEHHHRRSDCDYDAQRIADLSAAGWHMIPVTPGTRPESLRQAVNRAVEDRRRLLEQAPAPPAVDRHPPGPGRGEGDGATRTARLGAPSKEERGQIPDLQRRECEGRVTDRQLDPPHRRGDKLNGETVRKQPVRQDGRRAPA